MPHLESLEDRRHFITGVDTSFASGGLSVKGEKIRQLLPAPAGIFIQTVNAKKPTVGVTVTRYTAAGHLDTAWGDGGHIAADPAVDGAGGLAYDDRSGALYVASPTAAGDVSGNLLNIRRYRADGKLDTTFGNRGTFLAVPAAVNKRKFTLDRMEPLAGGKLLIAFEQTDTVKVFNATQDQTDLNLLQLTRAGRGDATFGSRGVVTLATGTKTYNTADTVAVRADTQTLTGLRTRADGSVRVLTLRDNSTETTTPVPDDEIISLVDAQRLTTVVVNANGGVRKSLTRSWTVSRSSDTVSGGDNPPTLFHTLSNELDPDGNVAVIGRRGDSGGTVVLRLSNTGVRSAPQALALPAGQTARSSVLAGDGATFVDTGAAIVKFDAGLSPVRDWGTDGVLATPDPVDADLAADTQGRLFVLDADRVHVRRLDGD